MNEPGLWGVQVTLYPCTNENLVIDATTADTSGQFRYENIVPGCYIVQFATPSGFVPTVANVGSDVSDSDPDANGDASVWLLPGIPYMNVDAGFVLPAGSLVLGV